MKRIAVLLWVIVSAATVLGEEPVPLKQGWDYAPAMKKVAERFKGNPGVVLHVGDSITHANPYGQWARGGTSAQPHDHARGCHAAARRQ